MGVQLVPSGARGISNAFNPLLQALVQRAEQGKQSSDLELLQKFLSDQQSFQTAQDANQADPGFQNELLQQIQAGRQGSTQQGAEGFSVPGRGGAPIGIPQPPQMPQFQSQQFKGAAANQLLGQLDPSRQAQLDLTRAQTGKLRSEASALGQPVATKAADIQVLDTKDGFVAFNKLTGQRAPLGLESSPTLNKLGVKEVLAIDKKIANGEATEADMAHRLNLLSAGTQINMPRPAPAAFYDRIDTSVRGLTVADDLLAHFEPGGAGWDSTGPINAVWTYLQDKFGVIPPEKQVFRQDSTRLFSAIKELNAEARLSDADLKFLVEAVPKRRTNAQAYIAGLKKLKENSARGLKTNINRLDVNNYNIADENRAFYDQLLQGTTLSGSQQPANVNPAISNMSDAQLDAFIKSQQGQ